MFCLSCKERIPLISNIEINDNNNIYISFYCQCNNDNVIYDLNDCINKFKDEDRNIINYKCLLHKEEDIEFFCIDCIKEFCYKCDKFTHIKLNHKIHNLNSFFKLVETNLKFKNNYKEIINKKIKDNHSKENFIKFCDLVYNTFNKYKDNYSSYKNVGYIELIIYDLYDLPFNINNEREINDEKEKKNKIINRRKYLKIIDIDINNQKIFEQQNIVILFILLFDYQQNFIIYSKDLIYYVKENNKQIDIINKIPNPDSNEKFIKLKYLNHNNYFTSIFEKGKFTIFKIENNKIKQCFKFIPEDEILTAISFIYINKNQNLICGFFNKIHIFSVNDNFNKINEILNENHSILFEINYNNSKLYLSPIGELTFEDGKTNKKYLFGTEEAISNILEIQSINSLGIVFFNNIIDIYDLELKSYRNKLKGHSSCILDLKEIKKEKRLISCSEDSYIKIWDLIHFSCSLNIKLSLQPFNIVLGENNKILATSLIKNYLFIID